MRSEQTSTENSKGSLCIVYQRKVVNQRETLDVMCLVQKHLHREQNFNNVKKRKANQFQCLEGKNRQMRTVLVCPVVVGRDDCHGPSDLKFNYTDLWFQCSRDAERLNSDVIAASFKQNPTYGFSMNKILYPCFQMTILHTLLRCHGMS